MNDLKISVIMPSFNQAAYIEEAINSVLSQDYPHKELIIIDGGSTDGSVEIIRKYSSKLSYWVSEADTGQSNAINKGFAKASGELLTWSNSDDILLPGTLGRVAMHASSIKNPMQRWIIGGNFWLNPEGFVLRCSQARSWCVPLAKRGLVSVYSPSSFFSKELINELGYLDESLHYAMDSELWLRFARHGIKYTRSKGYFWGLRLHAEAKVSGHLFSDKNDKKANFVLEKRKLETSKIRTQHCISDIEMRTASVLHKLFSAKSPEFWSSKFNTWQYRGKHWNECINLISQSN